MSAKPTPTDSKAKKPSLNVVFADAIPANISTQKELVQGFLTANGQSLVVGDSNSGKTALAITLAAAISRGSAWMGRETDAGIVVYLAAEAPTSVMSRLKGYQEHYGVQLPNLVIVPDPVNLFVNDKDAEAIIETVRALEAKLGKKVLLIIADTLARLSLGANENTAQDMGPIIDRVDRIREKCNAHFMLIHHLGKMAGAGARGWSGLRAAVDTEIRVCETKQGRYAEITKSRDLNAKGVRIGFALASVDIGRTNFGEVATACFAVPAEAPRKQKTYGKVATAVLKYLRTRGDNTTTKADIVRNFDGTHPSSSVYRAIRELSTEAEVVVSGDKVTLVPSKGNAA